MGGVPFWLFRVRESIGAKETKTLSQGDRRKARAECEPGGRNEVLSKATWARRVGEKPTQSSEHRGAGPQELEGWGQSQAGLAKEEQWKEEPVRTNRSLEEEKQMKRDIATVQCGLKEWFFN